MRRWLWCGLVVLAFGCTDADATHLALHKAGFTQIEAGGHAWFACGRDDLTATRFYATNPQGLRVEGVVCCGVFKHCTVRF